MYANNERYFTKCLIQLIKLVISFFIQKCEFDHV
jgi:hypothetical protein